MMKNMGRTLAPHGVLLRQNFGYVVVALAIVIMALALQPCWATPDDAASAGSVSHGSRHMLPQGKERVAGGDTVPNNGRDGTTADNAEQQRRQLITRRDWRLGQESIYFVIRCDGYDDAGWVNLDWRYAFMPGVYRNFMGSSLDGLPSDMAAWQATCQSNGLCGSGGGIGNAPTVPTKVIMSTPSWRISEEQGVLVIRDTSSAGDYRYAFFPDNYQRNQEVDDFADEAYETEGSDFVTLYAGKRWTIRNEGGVLVFKDMYAAKIGVDRKYTFYPAYRNLWY